MSGINESGLYCNKCNQLIVISKSGYNVHKYIIHHYITKHEIKVSFIKVNNHIDDYVYIWIHNSKVERNLIQNLKDQYYL